MDIEKLREHIEYLENNPFKDDTTSILMNENCVNCPNHPQNGGNGICHCTLGYDDLVVF